MTLRLDKQKLRCLMLVNDELGEKMYGSKMHGVAYWRAFIVEDRATGEMSAMYRFKHADGKSDWVEIKTDRKGNAGIEHLRTGLEETINLACEVVGLKFRAESFFPPDDEGDFKKVIEWLLKYDLIEQPRIEMRDKIDAN